MATVSKTGKVTAKKTGTAKIKITVSGNNYKKKTTGVKIKVKDLQGSAPNPSTPEAESSVTEICRISNLVLYRAHGNFYFLGFLRFIW